MKKTKTFFNDFSQKSNPRYFVSRNLKNFLKKMLALTPEKSKVCCSEGERQTKGWRNLRSRIGSKKMREECKFASG